MGLIEYICKNWSWIKNNVLQAIYKMILPIFVYEDIWIFWKKVSFGIYFKVFKKSEPLWPTVRSTFYDYLRQWRYTTKRFSLHHDRLNLRWTEDWFLNPIFRIAMWNAILKIGNRLSCTNNILERFHSTLQGFVAVPHQTSWKIIICSFKT